MTKKSNKAPDRRASNLPNLERPLTIAEVAQHYRVSERTIRRYIDKGTLRKEPGFERTVRISADQLPRGPTLTVAEVAQHYRVSERTVRKRISKGTLRKDPRMGRTVRISTEQLRPVPAGEV